MNEDMKTLNKSVDDLTQAHIDHEQRTFKKNEESQERINFMNYRILEIRQLTGIGREGGLTKTHLKRIREMKRGSIFESTIEDGLEDDDLVEDEDDEYANLMNMAIEEKGREVGKKISKMESQRSKKKTDPASKSANASKGDKASLRGRSKSPVKPKRKNKLKTVMSDIDTGETDENDDKLVSDPSFEKLEGKSLLF